MKGDKIKMDKNFFNKHCHYSIRKFAIGVASVMIGASIFGVNLVEAAETGSVGDKEGTITQAQPLEKLPDELAAVLKKAEENAGNILATFSTGPAIKDTVSNLISEILGTFVLVLTIFALGLYDFQAGIGTFAVSTLIVGIGLSLGGTTGYALNPARDLGPRIMHSILPISNKGDGDWSYAWIPVVGPVIGAVLAVLVFSLF